MRKIDIHCHATNRPLKHTISPKADLSTIWNEMAKHEIHFTVVLASYFPDPKGNHGTGISNYRLKSWLEDWNSFVMFGSLDFNHYFYQGLNELEELAEKKAIRGIKIYTGYQNIAMTDLEEVLKLCSKFQLPIMFHTGDCAGSRGHASIDQLDGFVEKYSDVNFIYTHLCNPNLESIIERVKRYKNVHTDMSGMIHSGKDDLEIPQCIENLKRFYGECGTNQLMFGTDFPVQTHDHSVLIGTQSIDALANENERDRFWFKNAAFLLKVADRELQNP